MAGKSAQARTEKEILQALEELGGKTFSGERIKYGDELVLRKDMNLRQTAKHLNQIADEEEEHTRFARIYDYRPYDGAYCMWNALQRQYHGLVSHHGKSFETMFGKMSTPPTMITVPCDVGKTTQIPWGEFVLPGLKDVTFEPHVRNDDERGPLFMFTAVGPKAMRFAIDGIFELVEIELRTNSMYRGKAIDAQDNPGFVDVFSVDPAKVVYSRQVMEDLGAMIWAKIRHPEEFSSEELKTSVVLHGPFGTGKTLACMLTGQIAVQNKMTFIRVKPGRDNFMTALSTAGLYDPCVVFAEDVDQEMDPRTINRLLDELDGIEAKGKKIIAILTTNYPELIHEGVSRPGRIDAFIEINDLDLEGVRALVQSRLGDLLEEEIDWEAVFEAAREYKPAFVTQFASRTKSYLVNAYGSAEGHKVGTAQLVAAANGMRSHHERTQPRKRIDSLSVDQAMKRAVEETLHEQLDPDYLLNGSR